MLFVYLNACCSNIFTQLIYPLDADVNKINRTNNYNNITVKCKIEELLLKWICINVAWIYSLVFLSLKTGRLSSFCFFYYRQTPTFKVCRVFHLIVEIYRIWGWSKPSGHPALLRWCKWTVQGQIVSPQFRRLPQYIGCMIVSLKVFIEIIYFWFTEYSSTIQ